MIAHLRDEAIDPQWRCTQEQFKYQFNNPQLIYSSPHTSSSTPLISVVLIQIPWVPQDITIHHQEKPSNGHGGTTPYFSRITANTIQYQNASSTNLIHIAKHTWLPNLTSLPSSQNQRYEQPRITNHNKQPSKKNRQQPKTRVSTMDLYTK